VTGAAIIGYAARLPGADTVEDVWDILHQARCTVSSIPEERWASLRFLDADPDAPGHSYSRAAGVLADPFGFDAAYFGISPVEAEQMDPQQRLLLEVTALALEHAGLNPATLDKARTGVFIGASSSDHSTLSAQDPSVIGAHFMLGNTLSILSNRISYQWDLQGPSYTVDTACSSSLLALDQARRAISDGTIDTAIVGGVNLLLSPMAFIGFSKAGMLSKDGLCKAFAANADGYVRAEGAVVFILRRLDLARRSENWIRSVLVGSGVSTAGRTSGIAIPSSERQADLIDTIMESFGIDPNDIAYAEAHGTGTAVGDPREASALGETYGKRRRDPLPIGSAKSNFGHLEPASGLVGLLKAQLVLEKGVIPASLHAETLNPDIDFAGLNLDVVREARRLPAHPRPWLASVNSFGFGGSNVHAVIRQPGPEHVCDGGARDVPASLLLSAASEAALRSKAAMWRARCDAAPDGLSMEIANANWNGPRLRHRLCLAAGSADHLRKDLDQWLSGQHPARKGARATDNAAPVAFVFSGNGAVWDGMARMCYLNDPVFRDRIASTNDAMRTAGGPNIIDLLLTHQTDAALADAMIAQPLHFAVQVALVDALAAVGVRPSAVLGHSLGEVAAAVAANGISREDAARKILGRGLAFKRIQGQGAMVALSATREVAADLIRANGLSLDIAAENSPRNVTISGGRADLDRLIKLARSKRIAGKLLPIDYPYHSTAVDVLKDHFLSDVTSPANPDGDVAFYSGWQGQRINTDQLTTDYWWQNARQPVEFRAGLDAMVRDGLRVFVEISPRTVLRGYMTEVLEQSAAQTQVLESLDKLHAEQRSAAGIARSVLAAGGRVDEMRLLGHPRPFRTVPKPYPFERQHFALNYRDGIDVFGQRPLHPLLGGRLSPNGSVWHSSVSCSKFPWLADHKVAGRVLLPASAILEIVLAAAREVQGQDDVEVHDLEILRAIEVPETGQLGLRLQWDATAKRLTLDLKSGQQWVTCAFARVLHATGPAGPAVPLVVGKTVDGLFDALSDAGLAYGPAFARLHTAAHCGDQVDAHLAGTGPEEPFQLDPTALDALFHAAAIFPELRENLSTGPFVPGRIGRVRAYGAGKVAAARLTLRSVSREDVCLDIQVQSADGKVLALIEGLRLRNLPQADVPTGQFWDEVRVPVAGGARPILPNMITALTPAIGAVEDDLDVLRSALAARFAWDLVARHPAAADAPDPRLGLCMEWLSATGYLTIFEDGSTALVPECPWPEMDVLISLLAEYQGDVHDVLGPILSVMTGAEKARAGDGDRLGGLVAAALTAAPKSHPRRVLLAGAIDQSLVDAALRHSAVLTIAAASADALAGIQVRLSRTDGIRYAVFDTLDLVGGFDLVIGVATTQTLATTDRKRLADFLAPGGEVLLAEERPDLFALLTGRQVSGDVIDKTVQAFTETSVPLTRHALAGQDSICILHGTRLPDGAPRRLRLNVTGCGAVADDLRALSEDAAEKKLTLVVVDPVRRARLAIPTALRELPQADVVWIVDVEGHDALALTGWRRSLVNETGRDIRTVSVPFGTAATDILAAIATSHDHEIILDATGLHSLRVMPVQLPTPVPATPLMRLHSRRRTAALDGLTWIVNERRAPQDHEVEIALHATGLNFRDVMWGQGLVPPEALEGGFAGQGFGMECSGTILRAGSLSAFSPGQRVLAFAPQAFASHVTVPAQSVLPVPEGLSLDQAAAVPVIFLTADYALNELARLTAEDVVLIHGAAGGVGLAAIQIAQAIGARVIGTAGSDEKRRFLAAMGVGQVLDSRSTDFADRVMDLTDGRGVDVVINSLAGEGLERSLACMAPFGRFVELGKRDIYANSPLAMRSLRQNISFFAVDADQLLGHRPKVAARVLHRVAAGLANGTLRPPPVQVFEPANIDAAFRLMQRSGHIGKIVVRAPRTPSAMPLAEKPDLSGAWLVVGGTGGFGLATAEWLTTKGATALWLVSRSGFIEPDALRRVLDAGIRVEVRAVDVTLSDQIDGLMAEIAAAGDPLAGIVHAGAVMDDALFEDLDDDRIARVVAPKLEGAELLDAASRHPGLRHFWLFSSVAARFGNPGQSAYVAANRGLEAIAARRRAAGLPGLAIAWGPISDTGMLARDTARRSVISTRLGPLLTADAALDALDQVLRADPGRATITIAPIRWSRIRKDIAILESPLFDMVPRDAASDPGDQMDLARMIAVLGDAAARKAVLDVVIAETARITRCAPSEIDSRRPFVEIGFDSLMAMSLKVAAEDRLGTDVPIRTLADDLSPAKLVQDLFDGLGGNGAIELHDELSEKHLTQTEISDHQREEILTRARRRTIP
jgi:phthiocerol/phenolphthiocerol synthesis type-I polyketide synthase C